MVKRPSDGDWNSERDTVYNTTVSNGTTSDRVVRTDTWSKTFTDRGSGTFTADINVRSKRYNGSSYEYKTSEGQISINYTAQTFTVTFNGNGGGTPSPTSKTVTYNSTYGTLATCSRTGFSLKGWYTATSGGTKIETSTTVSITANQTLYAQWTPNTYTVSYNINYTGGTNPSSKTVVYGQTYGTLASPTRTGYTFNGWYTAASGGTQVTASTTYSTAGNSTLYAHWTANSYTLTFNKNGGNTPSKASMSVTYDSTYSSLATCSRTGYTFKEWNTNSSGTGTKIANGDTVKITANTTVYAIWTVNTYTVTFNANGGGTPNPASKTVTYDAAYGTLATISRSGYKFLGWFTAASGGNQVLANTTVQITANQTLYAHWEPMSIIRVKSNGTLTTYTKIFVVQGGVKKQVLQIFVVQGGVKKQCV